MITKVHNGWLHTGLGHRQDPVTHQYPVYPLPRWSTYNTHTGEIAGTYKDIYLYMDFAQNSYQTSDIPDLSGDDIATTICNLYGTDANEELKKINTAINTKFKSWTALYNKMKQVKYDRMVDSMSK